MPDRSNCAAATVNVATPLPLSAELPSRELPSMKSTLPVGGMPEPLVGVTVAVRTYDSPEGLRTGVADSERVVLCCVATSAVGAVADSKDRLLTIEVRPDCVCWNDVVAPCEPLALAEEPAAVPGITPTPSPRLAAMPAGPPPEAVFCPPAPPSGRRQILRSRRGRTQDP